MHKQIYVNLPCKSLPASKAFFEALGYRFNPQFTNDQGACLELGENLYAMLLAEDFARTFTSKAIVDAKAATEVLICLSCDSRHARPAPIRTRPACSAASRPSGSCRSSTWRP